MTVEAKKQSNRAIQRTHATYKKKSEISEALNEIRPYINVSTYKFLSHFLFTNGSGVTQIKISEWCKKVGISLGSYHKTVKPEIESIFKQSLIIKTEAPMKYDTKRKKKVKASEFKSLMPLSVIKHLVKQFKQDEKIQNEAQWEISSLIEIDENEIESEIESEIASEITSNGAIPCESKDEGTFSNEQNKSFREKPLEKSIKILNNNKSIIEIDSFSNQPKKYFVKKEIKKLVESEFPQLSKDAKNICGNEIQYFLSNYKKLNLDDIAELVESIYPNESVNNLGAYFYKSLENAFLDSLLIELGVDLDEKIFVDRAYDDLDELREQIKRAYFEGNSAYMEFATAIESKPKKAPKRQARKPIRTELVSDDWMNAEEYHKQFEEKAKEPKSDITVNSIQAKLNAFHENHPRKVNNLWDRL